jgi:hypothetical protein
MGWSLGTEHWDDRATSSVAHADASAREVMSLWLAEGRASEAVVVTFRKIVP